MSYKIKLSKQAEKDLINIKQSNLYSNVLSLFNKMKINPFCYPPSYEKLVLKYKMYSKRINIKHRLIYMVNENKKEIYIIRMWTHYEK